MEHQILSQECTCMFVIVLIQHRVNVDTKRLNNYWFDAPIFKN